MIESKQGKSSTKVGQQKKAKDPVQLKSVDDIFSDIKRLPRDKQKELIHRAIDLYK